MKSAAADGLENKTSFKNILSTTVPSLKYCFLSLIMFSDRAFSENELFIVESFKTMNPSGGTNPVADKPLLVFKYR